MGDELLDSKAKTLITGLAIGLVIDTVAGIAAVKQILAAVGEQNIDPELARKMVAAYQKAHGLEKVKTKYLKTEDPAYGPHFDPGSNPPHGVVRGPDAKTSKDAIKNHGPLQNRISLDSPEIALHEFGHARSHKEQTWTSKLYGLGALGGLGSIILSFCGMHKLATVVAAIGSIPVLLEERKASQYAEEFLRQQLPKEQADKAALVLKRAFRTYLYGAASSVAQPMVMGFLDHMQKQKQKKAITHAG